MRRLMMHTFGQALHAISIPPETSEVSLVCETSAAVDVGIRLRQLCFLRPFFSWRDFRSVTMESDKGMKNAFLPVNNLS